MWVSEPESLPYTYVKALAAELRDTFTRSVLTRMQMTNAQLKLTNRLCRGALLIPMSRDFVLDFLADRTDHL